MSDVVVGMFAAKGINTPGTPPGDMEHDTGDNKGSKGMKSANVPCASISDMTAVVIAVLSAVALL